MKKIVSLILATMLLASVAVFAAVPDVKAGWSKTIHVSYDEIYTADGATKVMCGGDSAKINAFAASATATNVVFWGWTTSNTEITGFSYSINGGEKVTDASFKAETGEDVINAGEGAYDSRFRVNAAVTAGTQLVRVYVNYADGTAEAIWACEVTIGEATDYTDNEADAPSTPSTPSTPSNPETGDAMIVAIVAVATVALAGVAVSKKVRA